METNKSNKGSKIVIVILAILLAALGFFTYQNNQKNKVSEEALLNEKLEIQADLDAKIAELDVAIADNTSMKDELIAAKSDIVAFRDSVKDLKTLRYQTIRRYKKKLADLEAINNQLLQESERLKQENYALTVEVDSTKAEVERRGQTIERKEYENDSLSNTNFQLQDKIKIGSVLQVDAVKVLAMKEKRSGELKETTRAKRTDAFRIAMIIRANAIAEKGQRELHVVVKDASGKTVSGMDSFTSKAGREITYSDKTMVDYDRNDKEVLLITSIPEDTLEKGIYYVDVYLDNQFKSTGQITLK